MSHKIGITGGIGSGKTTACMVFKTLGIPVYDADARAKELMNSNPALIAALTEYFGRDIYDDDGLNRRKLADIIFNDQLALEKVNSCVHPAVARDFDRWRYRQTAPYVIEESAIIFEKNLTSRFDKVIVVTAPERIRIERVCAREQVTPDVVRQRIANQWPEENKIAVADYIINNDNSRLITPQILVIHRQILSLPSL